MFMQPQIYHGPYTKRETYIEGIQFYPLGDAPELDSDDGVESEETCNGYLVRLIAPGDLDRTEWRGFYNELAALEHLLDELDGYEDEPEYVEIQHRLWELERKPMFEKLHLQRYKYEKDEYDTVTHSWHTITEPDDNTSLSYFKPDDNGDYIEIPFTNSGDYGGSGVIGEANRRHFLTQYPSFPIYRACSDYSFETLMLKISDLFEHEDGESILDDIKSLEGYCNLDDDLLSQVEIEWQDNAWIDYVESDLIRVIEKRFPDWEIDTIDRDTFEEWASDQNEYWETNYNSAYIDVEKIVSRLSDDDISSHLKYRSFSLLHNDVPYGTFDLEYPKTYSLDTLPGIYVRDLESVLDVWPEQDTLGEWRIVENE